MFCPMLEYQCSLHMNVKNDIKLNVQKNSDSIEKDLMFRYFKFPFVGLYFKETQRKLNNNGKNCATR